MGLFINTLNNYSKALNLLRKYLQVYWLKPFDAVNDTANAIALSQFDWSKSPILEIGGGDGVFSFIMHGGEYNFLTDRYTQTDLARKDDIYDVYKEGLSLKIKKVPLFKYDAGLDLKLSHLLKSKELDLYKSNNLISSKPEALPFKNRVFDTVFLYLFHGLTDYKESLTEIKRIIKEGGNIFIIVLNETVRNNFICYKMHKYCKEKNWSKLSKYFFELDGGRYTEIGGIFSKSLKEWEILFKDSGFEVEEVYGQVSPLLWRIYDTQTRPFLKPFIRFGCFLRKLHLMLIVKFIWVYLWFPVLTLCYLVCGKPKRVNMKTLPQQIFFTMKLKAV